MMICLFKMVILQFATLNNQRASLSAINQYDIDIDIGY